MARTLNQVLATLPVKRRAKIERRASELATLKDLRHAVERTKEELAVSLGVGQDTISRIERRSDMLLSTLRRYVEAMGGKLKAAIDVGHGSDRQCPHIMPGGTCITIGSTSRRRRTDEKHGNKNDQADLRAHGSLE